MKTEYLTDYSPALGRDMECMVYGHAGRPVLYIPCQDGRFFDFGDFHMAETLAPWIESGQIIVFSVDTIDRETWSDKGGDPYWRARRHEQWMDYLTKEMAPRMLDRTGQDGILSFGCSLGATHAANLYLRRPDLFNGMLALSGIYNADYGFGGYMDEVVYQNSPVHYMANLPENHYYIDIFNKQRAAICVGLGPWELPDTTRQLADIFYRKGIHTWVDFWGHDCAHDWPWWYKQAAYFFPWLLGGEPGQ
ncbi:MAG: esterase family protein [Lawsonibacter sp.]|nr:esterase family protein [Lawsonibacter sp.]